MTAEMTLDYNPDGTAATHTMILMHGLGADANDLYPLAPALADGRLRVVCPDAPVRPVTLNGGITMRAWYDIGGANLEDRQDAEGVAQSQQTINNLIAAEKQRGFTASQIFLAGFSQGAAMALYSGLRYDETLAGIVVLSGYLLFADNAEEFHPANNSTPIFQTHGTNDPVVLAQWAQKTRDVLCGHNYTLTYKEYDAEHTITPAMIADLNVWLAQLTQKENIKNENR